MHELFTLPDSGWELLKEAGEVAVDWLQCGTPFFGLRSSQFLTFQLRLTTCSEWKQM